MRKIFLYDDVVSESLAHIERELAEAQESGDLNVELSIMSYGGSVFDGIAIAERIIESPCHVTARVIGCAMSAAAVIACACDRIIMSEFDAMMLHTSRNAFGEVDEGAQVANQSILKIIRRRIESYSEKDLEQDRFFTAEEALKAGLIDEIKTVEPERAKLVARWAAHIRSFGGKTMDEEKKAPESTQEELEVAEGGNPTQAILDGIAAILDKLNAIEAKLSAPEVAECGADDDDKKDDVISASMRKVYARIGKACIPVANKCAHETTPESEKARIEKLYGDLKRFDGR